MPKRAEADPRDTGSRRNQEGQHGRDRDGRGAEQGNGTASARDHGTKQLSGSRAAILARQQLEELLGMPVETITGLSRHQDGFTVMLEVVEIERVPRTTDILATYRVELTPDGQLDGYERVNRYYRNQTDGGDQE